MRSVADPCNNRTGESRPDGASPGAWALRAVLAVSYMLRYESSCGIYLRIERLLSSVFAAEQGSAEQKAALAGRFYAR